MEAIQECLVTVLQQLDAKQPAQRAEMLEARRRHNQQWEPATLARSHVGTLVRPCVQHWLLQAAAGTALQRCAARLGQQPVCGNMPCSLGAAEGTVPLGQVHMHLTQEQAGTIASAAQLCCDAMAGTHRQRLRLLQRAQVVTLRPSVWHASLCGDTPGWVAANAAACPLCLACQLPGRKQPWSCAGPCATRAARLVLWKKP